MPGTGLGMHKGNGGEVLGMGKLGGMLAGGYMHMGVGRECELAGGTEQGSRGWERRDRLGMNEPGRDGLDGRAVGGCTCRNSLTSAAFEAAPGFDRTYE